MSSKKTIGIDARMFGDGFGLARYTKQLLQDIEPLTQFEFVVFLRADNFELYQPKGTHIRKVMADIKWYSLEEQFKLPGIITKENVDVMHFTHWNMPLLYRKPFVVTIHDLIMHHFPRHEATTLGPVLYWVKDKLHRLVVSNAAKTAKRILATAEFTKQDIIKTLGISEDKVEVIFQRATIARPLETVEVKDKYELVRPYVLTVGSAYPHKNLQHLLDAWKIVHKALPTPELLLVGKDSVFYDRLSQYIESTPSARHIGFVPDEELAYLYKHASAYVIPSLYEGFGLPPLEAMQYDVPVVASRASCLPEVLGDAALYVDATSPASLAKGIYTILTNETLAQHMKEQGSKRVDFFDKPMTEQLEKVYQHHLDQ